MNAQMHKLSDTGLYQQEVFKILAEYELARSQRHPNPITLLHISLNLEENDSKLVENIKQLLAGVLNTSLRISDIPAHYDDDFLVLMPVTDGAGGEAATKRLISRLEGTQIVEDGNTFNSSIHIGISTQASGESVSIDKLLAEAEKALQDARKQGPQAYAFYTQ